MDAARDAGGVSTFASLAGGARFTAPSTAARQRESAGWIRLGGGMPGVPEVVRCTATGKTATVVVRLPSGK